AITVVTDNTMLEKLSRALSPAPTGAAIVVQGEAHFYGGQHMGDRNYSATNSPGAAVGGGASGTAPQISTTIRQTASRSADAALTAAVTKALDAITSARLADPDKAEAAQTVEKIQKETEKAEADKERPSRLRRWLDSLAAVCKPAADAISAAKAVVV